LDLPDELMRLAKARAALRGMKLKELVTEALEKAIYYGQSSGGSSRAADGADDNVLVLDENCVFPLVRGDCGPELKKLTGGKATELLEKEDVERAIGSRRR
jgi:hypothetical protein